MVAILCAGKKPGFIMVQPGAGRNPSAGSFSSKTPAEWLGIRGVLLSDGVADLLLEADVDVDEGDHFRQPVQLGELEAEVPAGICFGASVVDLMCDGQVLELGPRQVGLTVPPARLGQRTANPFELCTRTEG